MGSLKSFHLINIYWLSTMQWTVANIKGIKKVDGMLSPLVLVKIIWGQEVNEYMSDLTQGDTWWEREVQKDQQEDTPGTPGIPVI